MVCLQFPIEHKVIICCEGVCKEMAEQHIKQMITRPIK